MKPIINRRGSKAATRAMKRLGCPRRTAPPKKVAKTPIPERPRGSCANAGWETTGKVAACNCCENGAFYTPISKNAG